MTKITYIEQDGTKHEVDAQDGMTLMEVAVKNSVPGIEAECGGACSCATCHVYIDKSWHDKLDEMDVMEEDMLDFAVDVKETSRLSCQIRVKAELEGIEVGIPEKQF